MAEVAVDEAGRLRFLEAADVDGLEALLAAVLRGLPWRDAEGAAVTPTGPSFEATSFGEAVDGWSEARVADWRVRFPAATGPRAVGLVVRDEASGAVAVLDDLVAALLEVAEPDRVAGIERLALEAARAAWPDDAFRWTGRAVERRWRVVGEVERWPGEVQLQAARRVDPALRIGDVVWLDGERLPACWVLDLLASRTADPTGAPPRPRRGSPPR